MASPRAFVVFLAEVEKKRLLKGQLADDLAALHIKHKHCLLPLLFLAVRVPLTKICLIFTLIPLAPQKGKAKKTFLKKKITFSYINT